MTVGFTAGIAAIIFASQLVPLLGLTLAGPGAGAAAAEAAGALAGAADAEPGDARAVARLRSPALVALRRLRPHWPRMLIVVALAAVVGWALGLAGRDDRQRLRRHSRRASRAGAAARPASAEVLAVLPNAFSFALLGAIESLLSAVVADGMTGRRHRSNSELVAQGVANVGSALFGGICVTGTIARTATNVRAGAHGPVAGMAHALFLLVFVLVAAPLAGYIPLAALAAVLAVVAWDMVEKPAIRALLARLARRRRRAAGDASG